MGKIKRLTEIEREEGERERDERERGEVRSIKRVEK